MNFHKKRAYRKSITAKGSIALNGLKHTITIKNISLSGVLAEIQNNTNINDLQTVLTKSTSLDIQIPDLQLNGQAEIIRIENKENQISLGLKFKQLKFDSGNVQQKRRSHRKILTVPGEILLHGHYHGFVSVNVSQDGMMIHLPRPCDVMPGFVTKFRFKKLDIEGEFKIIWTKKGAKTSTWIGGKCLNMHKLAEEKPSANNQGKNPSTGSNPDNLQQKSQPSSNEISGNNAAL